MRTTLTEESITADKAFQRRGFLSHNKIRNQVVESRKEQKTGEKPV